jgi:Immunity protein 22
MREHPEITFNEDGNVVSIWGGSFRTEQELDSYVESSYHTEPETEDLPISAFAEDIGLSSYDEDFLESDFNPSWAGDPEKLFEGFSYSTSYWVAAVEAMQRIAPGSIDSLILLFGYDHTRYPQFAKQPARVVFLGSFAYDPLADDL